MSKNARRKNRQARQQRKARELRKQNRMQESIENTARATAHSLEFDVRDIFRPRAENREHNIRMAGFAGASSLIVAILAWIGGIRTGIELFQAVWMWVLFGLGTINAIIYIARDTRPKLAQKA